MRRVIRFSVVRFKVHVVCGVFCVNDHDSASATRAAPARDDGHRGLLAGRLLAVEAANIATPRRRHNVPAAVREQQRKFCSA